MNERALGRSGLQVSPLCFGGNVFGWTADETTSFELLDAWVDAGLNFVDTADMYSRWVPGHSGGESETIVGKWIQSSGQRVEVVIATEVGKAMGDGEAGKVRAIGASNFTAARLSEALAMRAAHGLPRYECLKPHYNLVERSAYEAELEAVCVDHGLGVLAALDAMAARLNSTPAQVALAWQIARPSITAPIASATSLDQQKDLLAAASLKLDADAIHSIDRASAGR